MTGVSTHKSRQAVAIGFFCCNKVMRCNRFALVDTDVYKNRELFEHVCPVCGKKIYKLVELNFLNNNIVINRNKPKRDVSGWIDRLLSDKIAIYNIKKGNKAGMAFIYGVNDDKKQIGKDFNNTIRFVKVKG